MREDSLRIAVTKTTWRQFLSTVDDGECIFDDTMEFCSRNQKLFKFRQFALNDKSAI